MEVSKLSSGASTTGRTCNSCGNCEKKHVCVKKKMFFAQPNVIQREADTQIWNKLIYDLCNICLKYRKIKKNC